jgi:hypothetical protein
MPLFRRSDPKPNWGMNPTRMTYQAGYVTGYRNYKRTTNVDEIRALCLDATDDELSAELAASFYTSGCNDVFSS